MVIAIDSGKYLIEIMFLIVSMTFAYPIFEAAIRITAESAIVLRSSIAGSPYRELSLWLRHQLTFLSVSVHSRSLPSSHIGYLPDPFPSAACATRAKWPADGWGGRNGLEYIYSDWVAPTSYLANGRCEVVNKLRW